MENDRRRLPSSRRIAIKMTFANLPPLAYYVLTLSVCYTTPGTRPHTALVLRFRRRGGVSACRRLHAKHTSHTEGGGRWRRKVQRSSSQRGQLRVKEGVLMKSRKAARLEKKKAERALLSVYHRPAATPPYEWGGG